MDNRTKTFTCLLLILALAFGLRYYGFHHPHKHTFDESVYATLGYQLSQDFSNYNTRSIYKDCMEAGRNLPEHYNTPLFVHPPMHALLISFLYRFLPPYFETAHWVPFWCGIFMILIVFFLAKLLFRDNRIALFASFIVSIEPNHIICSEKIWMESTLAFFMTLSLLFFALGRQRNNKFFILCGIFSGLAMLSKTVGVVILIAFFLYGFLFIFNSLKNKSYLSIFPIALFIFSPWMIWQFRVFGRDIINQNIFWKIGFEKLSFKAIGIFAVIVVSLLIVLKKKLLNKVMSKTFLEKGLIFGVSLAVLALFFLPYGHVNLKRILDLSYIPVNGWFSISSGEKWYFYFGRFLELCPLYIFSYLSVAFCVKKNRSLQLLLVYLTCIFSFFIFWKSFQCRYVVSCVPPLAILASLFFFRAFDWLDKKDGIRFFTIKCFLVGITFLFIIKTVMVTWQMALPNLTCYY